MSSLRKVKMLFKFYLTLHLIMLIILYFLIILKLKCDSVFLKQLCHRTNTFASGFADVFGQVR